MIFSLNHTVDIFIRLTNMPFVTFLAPDRLGLVSALKDASNFRFITTRFLLEKVL